jgi:hypothetical protein
MKRNAIYYALFTIILAGFRCTFDTLSSEKEQIADSKTVSVAFSIATTDTFNRVALSAIVRVTAPDMDTISQSMTMNDSTISVTLSTVPVGYNRFFEVFVYDSLHILAYYGSQYADLWPNQRTYVFITLQKATTSEVVVIGTIKDDTIPDTTRHFVFPPRTPVILKGIIPAGDTSGFIFASGGSYCAKGCPISYVFQCRRYLYSNNTDSSTVVDTVWTIHAPDSQCSARFPQTGRYTVSAQALCITDGTQSSWSLPPLPIRVINNRQIVVDSTAVN